MKNFRAIYLESGESGKTVASVRTLDIDELPAVREGSVTVRVDRSTLNYKDGLAITGRSPVVREFPMIPGIDFTGQVIDSQDPDWQLGDEVILNGWGVGERYWGGLAQYARVRGDWLIRRPEGLTASEAMALGTAG
jgi:acrylyl-CoA reductase (NADPH)